MDARKFIDLLRRAPNINHARLNPIGASEVIVPAEVARLAADMLERMTDLLVDLHAYHDVPRRDSVLEPMFKRGADLLREMGRTAASVDRSGEADETSTKIEGSAEGESAVPAAERADAQTSPSESPL